MSVLAGSRRPTAAPPCGRDADALPDGFRIVLDGDVRRIKDGHVLIGGSPLRLVRLTSRGGRLVDHLESGEPVPAGAAAQRLVRRLLDHGMAHPRPLRPAEPAAVTVVVPVRDDGPGLSATLAAVSGAGRRDRVIVVDDESADGDAIAAATPSGTTVLRHPGWRGPAAARNTGWRASTDPFVAFVDAGCTPHAGWLDALLPHFSDPRVAAVAPRILAVPAPGTPPRIAGYEQVRSPLDLGPSEATVRPGSRVPYVPTAALVVRRAALDWAGGFDETLRVGEDVDLVWRLAAGGWTIRYVPDAAVDHPSRASWSAWLRQRFRYGSSAAPLARRHGDAVAPACLSRSSAVFWLLVVTGHPKLAAAGAAGSAGRLAFKLRPLSGTAWDASRLIATGHLRAGIGLARALQRTWIPVALALAASRGSSRRFVAAALVAPALLDWRPSLPHESVRFAILRLIDDAAYAAGVWAGCIEERSARALMPRIS